jgi:hypothetical protein
MDQIGLDEDYDTNRELIKEFDDLLITYYMIMFATISSWDLFNGKNGRKEGNPFVDPDIGVRDKLGNM